MDEQEQSTKQKGRKPSTERGWINTAREITEHVAIVAGTALVSGFCAALGKAAFGKLQDRRPADVTQLRKVM